MSTGYKLSAEQIARIVYTSSAQFIASLEVVPVPEDWEKLKPAIKTRIITSVKRSLDRYSPVSAEDIHRDNLAQTSWENARGSEVTAFTIMSQVMNSLRFLYDPSK